jgi:hypothetical protein
MTAGHFWRETVDYVLNCGKPPPPEMPDKVTLISYRAGSILRCQLTGGGNTWKTADHTANPIALSNWLRMYGFSPVLGTSPPEFQRTPSR